MGMEGKVHGTTYNSKYDILSYYGTWAYWKVNSQSVANNTSNVTIRIEVKRTDGYTGLTAYNLDDLPTVSLQVDGSAKTPSRYYLDTRNQTLNRIAEWTGDVPHESDGSLSLRINCDWSIPGVSALAAGSISGDAVLDTIPRASSFGTVKGLKIGESCTVNINRKSSSFTHQLWYKVGDSKWYDLGTGIGTSHTFTIAEETANQYPTSTTGSMQLRLQTYNGTTKVGGYVYDNYTVTIPDYELTSSGVSIAGQNLLDGVYVEDKSYLKVQVTAHSGFGAEIVSNSSTIDGKTYSGTGFYTSPLSAGKHRVTTTFKDSRGEFATYYSDYVTVESYSLPSITKLTVERDEEDSEKIIVKTSGKVSPVGNKNTISAKVALGGQEKTITTSNYAFDTEITFEGISTEITSTVTVTVTDAYTSTSLDKAISTVDVTMDFYHTGKGIAFGKVAEKDGLEVNWESYFNKFIHLVDGTGEETRIGCFDGQLCRFGTSTVLGIPIDVPATILDAGNWSNYITIPAAVDIDHADYVTEKGTSGNWTYRKWSSGIAECWCNYSHTTAISKSWGSMYYSDSLSPKIDYPFTFKERPIENVTFRGETSAGWLYTEGGGYSTNTTTQTGQYGVCRPTSIGSSNLMFDYYVVGKWK